ncbi:MAG: hypothetical protein ACHQFW_11020, partial [Chitinophagales bacterium]
RSESIGSILMCQQQIIFSLYSLLALVRIRTTTFREFILFVTGILLIYFLSGTMLFWFDLLPQFFENYFYFPTSIENITVLFTTETIIKFILIGIVLIISLIFYSNKFSSNLIQVRRYLGSFIILFIFSLLSILLNKYPGESALYFLFITSAIFISYYFFHSPNQAPPELMHMGLLGATVIFQYINFTS